MIKLLRTGGLLLFTLVYSVTVWAQSPASATIDCCADEPICAGDTASIWVSLRGTAPYQFSYTDGSKTYQVTTRQAEHELKVAPQRTRHYQLRSMSDASGSGSVCGQATVAVNQCSPPQGGRDCSQTGFTSEIISQQTQGSCTNYTVEVSTDGNRYALSHFNISVPCGSISNVSNSEGWPMEVGNTDPTTGITGIKVDDIQNFGEDGAAGSFTVSFTLCENSCGAAGPACSFVVAYKASTCVTYGIAEPPYLPMDGVLAAEDAHCFGSATGNIYLDLDNGTAPYTYQWSNGATTKNLEKVAAGTYTLTVTDATGATLQLSAEVGQPQALSLTTTPEPSRCGEASGSITTIVKGGTAPYTYQWSNGATNANLEQLAAGTYTLTVTDAQGCQQSQSVSVEGSSTLDIAISTSGSCQQSTLSASVSGGNAPYSYQWSTGATTASISPSQAGTYTVRVTDASGCTAQAQAEASPGGTPPAITYEYSQPSCGGQADGAIYITVDGGQAPYTISWSNGSTGTDLEGLEAGTYTVTVTDAQGCSSSQSINLPAGRSINVLLSEVVHPSCTSDYNYLEVYGSGGTGPYTYQWSNGATGSYLEEVAPGVYTVAVTDAQGCTTSRSFSINPPNVPQLSISGGQCGDSTLTATVSGGTAPYTYSWNTGEGSATITGADGQSYTVTVTDANGCSSQASVSLGIIGTPIEISYTTVSPGCYGQADGSIDLDVSGGSGPLDIVWNTGDTTEDLSNISGGTYTVTVTDSTGCSKSQSISLSQPQPISISQLALVNVNCNGKGSISVSASQGVAPYTYAWSNGQSGNSASDLEAGYHTVTVTDASGCSSSRTFVIRDASAPQVSIRSSGSCGSVTLYATVAGGSYPYQYQWSNGSTQATISPDRSGTYALSITDANGCSAEASYQVSLNDNALQLTAHTVNISCFGQANGSATIEASGGQAPYRYDWSNGYNGQLGANLSAGTYSVRVTDAAGCYDVVAFEISAPAQALSLQLVEVLNSNCGQANGLLEVEARGGTAPYTYQWSTGQTGSSLSQLMAGSYQLSVTDAAGCSQRATYDITDQAGSVVTAALAQCADVLIQSGETVEVAVQLSGEGPYTLSYTDGSTTYTVEADRSPLVLSLSPQQTTTYTLSGVNNSCGEGSALGSVTVFVADPKFTDCGEGCFTSNIVEATATESCTTYTLEVNAGDNCRYGLSHYEIALACGTVSSMSNSEGWPMSVGLDPTTGIYGIKVDGIEGMESNDSFTVTYTVCSTTACDVSLDQDCGQWVGYKAGQCVYYGQATPAPANQGGPVTMGASPELLLYPNPAVNGSEVSLKVKYIYIPSPAQVIVRNGTGQIIWQSTVRLEAAAGSDNTAYYTLPLELQTGNYFVSIQLYDYLTTKQLVVY